MWDNPTKFFNTEYVEGKSNVQEYDSNFLAIHGINQFYEKKGPKKWLKKGHFRPKITLGGGFGWAFGKSG